MRRGNKSSKRSAKADDPVRESKGLKGKMARKEFFNKLSAAKQIMAADDPAFTTRVTRAQAKAKESSRMERQSKSDTISAEPSPKKSRGRVPFNQRTMSFSRLDKPNTEMALKQDGKRVYTRMRKKGSEQDPNEMERDYTYDEMYSHHPHLQRLSQRRRQSAFKAALDSSRFEKLPRDYSELSLDPDEDRTAQAYVHHTLAYQRSNLGPVRDKAQSEYNQHEFAKSKRILADMAKNPKRLAAYKKPAPGKINLSYGAPGLINQNLPQPKTILSGSTYKAQYVESKRIFSRAFHASRKRKKPNELKEMDKAYREEYQGRDKSEFNKFMQVIGLKYGREGIERDETMQSDDELPSEVYDTDDEQETANRKRRKVENMIGTGSKMLHQQMALADPDQREEYQKKYQRLSRRTHSLNRDLYEKFFKMKGLENAYKQKRKNLDPKEQGRLDKRYRKIRMREIQKKGSRFDYQTPLNPKL